MELTVEKLNELHYDWLYRRDERAKYLRFGQYVYHYTGIEYDNSYNETDHNKAYELLSESIQNKVS